MGCRPSEACKASTCTVCKSTLISNQECVKWLHTNTCVATYYNSMDSALLSIKEESLLVAKVS